MKFFKLAWMRSVPEFASRHTQYEMFYAGATFVTKGHSAPSTGIDAPSSSTA